MKPPLNLVILESPFGSKDPKIVQRNINYARRALRHSLFLGESPIASHLLYTQPGVLDDNNPEERRLGIDAGLAWRAVAHKSVVYTDLGITEGMKYGIEQAEKSGLPVIYRSFSQEFSQE